MDISFEKVKLRETILKKLKEQSAESRCAKSKTILEKLKHESQFEKSRNLMFYIAMSEEVDTLPLLLEVLREGRCVTVPRVDQKTKSLVSIQIQNPEEDLISGTYGIMEPRTKLAHPFDVERLDLVLVPGIAFDKTGRRLGRGKGYYDRFLSALPPHVKRYGLAFDFQLFESIPAEEHDILMDRIITDKS